jgi:hypothetical protein
VDVLHALASSLMAICVLTIIFGFARCTAPTEQEWQDCEAVCSPKAVRSCHPDKAVCEPGIEIRRIGHAN